MRGEDDEGADELVPLAGIQDRPDRPPRKEGGPAHPPAPPRPPEFERLLTEVIVSGGSRLLRLAASFCPADAEDILNIATERALKRPEAFAHGNPGQLYRWLERTVRNECLKTLRARRREQLTDPADLARAAASDAAAQGPHAIAEATQERIATLEALGELHPTEAGCLALRARGFSRAEIAEMLGITPLTVKRRLADGRAALAEFSAELASGRRCARLARALAEYADDALGASETPRLERHIAHCGRCRARLSMLRRQGPRVAAALPPALLLPAAQRADDVERDLQVSRQLAEAAGDEWLALWGGFWARVGEGWHALTPVGRLAGTGAAAVLALAGLGSFGSGGERPAAPAEAQSRAEAPASASRFVRVDASRAAPRQKAGSGRPESEAGRDPTRPGRARKAARASSARAPSATHRPSTVGGDEATISMAPPKPSERAPLPTHAPPEGSARAEFEPGPP
jgi:RNA polymerase sigma factor (sigma-70 family)